LVRITSGTLYYFILESDQVSFRKVIAWNNARRGTWDLPLPVKLESRCVANTVSSFLKMRQQK
jgi:hypothetical protein